MLYVFDMFFDLTFVLIDVFVILIVLTCFYIEFCIEKRQSGHCPIGLRKQRVGVQGTVLP